MAFTGSVGDGRTLPAHANVREERGEYVIELDVADFTEEELDVELVGRRLTLLGDQRETPEDRGEPFRLHERLEESFRLPDDADVDGITVSFEHGTVEIHAPRTQLVPRRLPLGRPATLINPDAEPY